MCLFSQGILGQEDDYQKKIDALRVERQRIIDQEKDALKFEVREINKRLDDGEGDTEYMTDGEFWVNTLPTKEEY